jgi:hypothetical protein
MPQRGRARRRTLGGHVRRRRCLHRRPDPDDQPFTPPRVRPSPTARPRARCRAVPTHGCNTPTHPTRPPPPPAPRPRILGRLAKTRTPGPAPTKCTPAPCPKPPRRATPPPLTPTERPCAQSGVPSPLAPHTTAQTHTRLGRETRPPASHQAESPTEAHTTPFQTLTPLTRQPTQPAPPASRPAHATAELSATTGGARRAPTLATNHRPPLPFRQVATPHTHNIPNSKTQSCAITSPRSIAIPPAPGPPRKQSRSLKTIRPTDLNTPTPPQATHRQENTQCQPIRAAAHHGGAPSPHPQTSHPLRRHTDEIPRTDSRRWRTQKPPQRPHAANPTHRPGPTIPEARVPQLSEPTRQRKRSPAPRVQLGGRHDGFGQVGSAHRALQERPALPEHRASHRRTPKPPAQHMRQAIPL